MKINTLKIRPFYSCALGALGWALSVFASPSSALGQNPVRSSLYPTTWTNPTTASFQTGQFIQDFSFAGYKSGDESIPRIAGPIFDVTAPLYGADPNGQRDATQAIQKAIDAANSGGGGVVFLPAGTYKVSPGTKNSALLINGNNVVLRGEGRNRTFIYNSQELMRGKRIIQVSSAAAGNWDAVPSGASTFAIARDLTGPVTKIPLVSNPSGSLRVGDTIMLRADATLEFLKDINMDATIWANNPDSLGGFKFLRKITAINSTTKELTIDVPIRYCLKTRDSARVHLAATMVQGVGLEDFSIGNKEHSRASIIGDWEESSYEVSGTGGFDVHGSHAISMSMAYDCWISNVGSYCPDSNSPDINPLGRGSHLLSNGLKLSSCRFVTVQNCEFQNPLYSGAGGNGYMYALNGANECLLRDNVSRHCRHGFVFQNMDTSGNVILGGLSEATGEQCAYPGIAEGQGSDHHQHFSQSNLIDGVAVNGDYFAAHYDPFGDSLHGITAVHTVFWNVYGHSYQDSAKQTSARTAYIVVSDQFSNHGYIIGTRGPASKVWVPGSDFNELVGQGETLQPLSLYHDQLQRRRGLALPPPTPIAVVAKGGDSQVQLTWSPSSTATSYSIYRSTTQGGPYARIRTVSSPAYTNTNLADGVTYYYTITAKSAAGESGKSIEVLGLPCGAYQQESSANALIVAEAEKFDAILPQGGADWGPNAAAGFSGTGALQAQSNSGLPMTIDTGYTTMSPRLDYRINFARTGTHYVWLRGLGTSGNDDSAHVGLDGGALTTSDRMRGFGTTWKWSMATMDGPVATIQVGAPGIHTLNVWMREDGFALDKLLVTTSGSYVPTGTGPAESARLSGGDKFMATTLTCSPTSDGGTAFNVNDSDASGGAWMSFVGKNIGDYIDYTLPLISAGTYELRLRYKAHPNRGTLKLRFNHQQIGATLDQYVAGGNTGFFEVSMGTVTVVQSGDQKIRLTVNGKNPASTSSTDFVLSADAFTLVRVP